jgi:DNA-binding NarL/FixJ family response regulator
MHSELVQPVDGAKGSAPAGLSLAELRELALRVDSSNTVTGDPADAALAWRALVDGRYNVLDQFDARGRRYFVIRRRELSSARRELSSARLTSREREVLFHAALGYSGKRIAYEMGISQSTVALHMKSAAKKLGFGSRVRLVLALAAARRRDSTYCRGSPPK